jgi:hypothetical protein
MEKIGTYLYEIIRSGHSSPHNFNTWTFLGSGFDGDAPRYTATEQEMKGFVMKKLEELYQMNIEAVNQRYNEHTEDKFPGFCFAPVFFHFRDFLDLLRSLRYQCSEGDVTESALYQQLDWYIGKVCEDYIGAG